MSDLSKKASDAAKSLLKFSGVGLLLSSSSEKFEDNTDQEVKLSAGVIVLMVIIVILLAIIFPLASYNIMGKSILSAILTFFFGFVYIGLVWLWYGLISPRQLK